MEIESSNPTLELLPTNTDQNLPTPGAGRVGERKTPDSPKELISTNCVFVRSGMAGRIPMVASGVPACGVKGRLARLLHRGCARTEQLRGRSGFICWARSNIGFGVGVYVVWTQRGTESFTF
jgi:hypothetical protein